MTDEADFVRNEEVSREESLKASCPLCGSPAAAQTRAADARTECSVCGLDFRPAEPAEAPLPDDPASVLERWLAGEATDSVPLKIPRRRFFRKHLLATAAVTTAVAIVLLASAVPTIGYFRVSNDLARQQIEHGQLVRTLRVDKQDLQHRLELQRQASQRQLESGARKLRDIQQRSAQAAGDMKASWSRRLSAEAQRLRDENPSRSVLLAAEALHLTSTGGEPMLPEARQILHDALDGDEVRRLVGHTDRISSLAISPDSRLLASGSYDRTVRLWSLDDIDPSTTSTVLNGHVGYVSSVAFGPDNRRLISGSFDSTARIWDLGAEDSAASPVVLRGHRGRIGVVALSRNGRWLVTGSSGFGLAENSVRLWDLASRGEACASVELRGHLGQVHVIAASPDSRRAVTAGEDGTARLWDLTAERPATASISLNGHSGSVRCAAFSADSRYLVTGSDSIAAGDSTLNLWDLADETPPRPIVLRGHKTGVRATIATPDPRRIISLGQDNTVGVWHLAAGNPAAEVVLLPGGGEVIDMMTVSHDGRWLATGEANGTARIRDLACSDRPGTNAASIALKGHQGRIMAMAITPDSHRLVIAGDDNVIRVWTLRVDELVDLALQHVGRKYILSALTAGEPILLPPPVETDRVVATSFAPPHLPIPRISASPGPGRKR